MNCINHPDQPRAAFCQECGKPLCEACSRNIGGAVFCGPCLQARVGLPPVGGLGYNYPEGVVPPPASASPFLAGVLGFIPGVGAMYNGQFVKGLAHICIFAMLILITTHFWPFGLLIGGWVFYMVFDAIYTARARRDGDPLPDPLGLLKLENEMGMGKGPGAPFAAPYQGTAGEAQTTVPPVVGQSTGTTPPFTSEFIPGSNVPVGAVVLIALGVLFLLGSFNIFNLRLSHLAVPLFLIGLGVWLYFRNMSYGGVVDDGSGYFRAYAIRKLRGPAFLMLTGVLWLLDTLHIMRWHQGWGFYLLLLGILILAERMAGAETGYIAPSAPMPTAASQATATPEEMTAEAAAANHPNIAGEESPLTHRNTEGQE